MTAMWDELLKRFVDPIWYSFWFWRILGMVAVGAVVAAVRYKSQVIAYLLRPDYAQHDLGVFLDSQQIITASQLSRAIEWMDTNDSSEDALFERLIRLEEFLGDASNAYLLRPLRRHSAALLQALSSLTSFVALNFFHMTLRDVSFLRPNLDIDRGGSGKPEEMNRYEEYSDRMHALCLDVIAKNLAYQEAVHRTLPQARGATHPPDQGGQPSAPPT